MKNQDEVHLKKGDCFLQRHLLPWPESVNGPYRMLAGMYTRGSGRRLLHPGDPSDQIPLETGWFLTKNE